MSKALLAIALGVLLALTGVVGSVAVRTGPSGSSVPDVDPDGVDRGDLTSVMRDLEERVAEQPRDGRSLASLGHVYVEQSRVTGDLGYYAKADEVLDAALALDPTDDSALAGKASLAAARHDFSGALRQADAALRQNPYQSTALAIRVDALTELGRYGDQLAALRTANRRSPGSPVLLRLSYAYELRGRLDRAADMLDLALDGTTAPTDRAFALTLRADIDRKRGRLSSAAAHLRDAIAAAPDYAPAYASRARLAAARGDVAAAERLWREDFERSGSAESALELGRLYLLDGRDPEPQFRALAENREREIAADVDMDLEVALFEADHGSAAKALAAARREWGRRHSIHVADALAWALHDNGRPRPALRYAVAATRLGTPDAQFWLHRAAIEARLGMDAAARRHLRHGLDVDPGVSPWLVARTRDALVAASVG